MVNVSNGYSTSIADMEAAMFSINSNDLVFEDTLSTTIPYFAKEQGFLALEILLVMLSVLALCHFRMFLKYSTISEAVALRLLDRDSLKLCGAIGQTIVNSK
jgi:hypothetical protein